MSLPSRRSLLAAAVSTAAAAALPVVTATPSRAAAASWPYDWYPTPLCAGPSCPPVQARKLRRVNVDSLYAATPSVVVLPDGRWRMVYFNAPDHFGYGMSTVMTAVSADHGASWSPATPVSLLDPARDPCVSYADGAVWLTYFRAYSSSAPAEGVYTRRSLDGGASFGPAVRVDPGLPYAASSAPIVEHGGALWMVFYGRERNAAGQLEAFDSAYVAKSTDGGAGWTSRRIAHGQADGRGYAEPWLVVGPSSMLVMHRYGAWSQIGVTRSADDGASWTHPAPLFTGTGRAAAVRLSNGTLVSVYRHPNVRSAVCAVSLDDGRTWPWTGRPVLHDYADSQFGMVYGHPVEVAPNEAYFPVAMEESTSRCALWQGMFR